MEIAMNLTSNDELQRWVESFSCCPGLTVDDSCSGLIAPSGPQTIDVNSMHSLDGIIFSYSPPGSLRLSPSPVVNQRCDLISKL
ncbi:unnamed protein product [Gongylonema pulchrum]|uniref:Uncharacterized protein n=1 Tax=Gongylonema pulchrum TaxID=637853 RepID=A0A3P6RDC3_9BILA|nr:unnamed protein product [Gongylonema pulchrum]